MSQEDCIAEKLAKKFTYSQPLDIKYLEKFLKNSLKNDRKTWKAYFFEYTGERHPRCPVEAFTEWKKYWVSAAGREESMHMSEMRKGRKNRLEQIATLILMRSSQMQQHHIPYVFHLYIDSPFR